MSEEQFLSSSHEPLAARQPNATLANRLLKAVVGRAVPSLERGRLTIALSPRISRTVIGELPGHDATISINGLRGLWDTLRRGKLGFAESFMDGALEVDDLEQLFHLFLDNEDALSRNHSALFKVRAADKRIHLSRNNTRDGSRRNIAAHYDLGNAFYSQWLDAGMSYSSGIYDSPGATLEAAQALKHARILEALRLEPRHRLLEIGCGWGSMAEMAARRGAHVRAITISAEQLDWSRKRIISAGLADCADVAFQDYRDTTGTFDRIVSVEMIEAVGEAHWPDYFRVLSDRLAPGGRAVIQAITIPEPYFETYRASPDFIQRYIFPGGMLPTISSMRANSDAAGLRFTALERFGPSYARTLRDWRTRFIDAWPRIEAMGFDERFRRMWLYYLSYCAAGFERGSIDVGLYAVDKT